jgi:uncharacterized peroxidase-related enzyme
MSEKNKEDLSKAKPHETKIKLVEDDEARGTVADAYNEWKNKTGRAEMPGILKCFSARPDFLRQVIAFSDTVHFSEGHLSRRHKEMIATFVSALNHCPYWIDSHSYFLRAQGANDQTVDGLAQGHINPAVLPPREAALMEYVKKVTEAAYKTLPEDVQKLRDHGWSEPQIAEAVYITAMFAFFNRVADAFGVPSQEYGLKGLP